MNFEEYINQKNPAKKAIGSVIVTRTDFWHSWNSGDGLVIQLRFHADKPPLNYLVPKDETEGIMWTIDNDGNKENRSVFRLMDVDY